MMEQKKVKLTAPPDRTVYVWADAFKMSEVFTNYLSNAIHYVKEGGEIRITVEERTREDGRHVVRVSVFDEGQLLSEEALEKVFVKFYKEDAARTRSYGGSGIGLSIVEAIQKSHGQDYGAYNAENGVVFFYELDAEEGQGKV